MIKFVGFLCLVIFTFSACEHLEDYRLTLAATACTPRNCTQAGLLCETCSTLVGCVEQPDGSWLKTPVATCTAPEYCVHEVCTTNYDPFCWGTTDLPFNCSKVGVFPDPFYHNKFVLCVQEGASLKPYLNSCEPGFGFNIVNDICDIPLEDGECPNEDYPVPLCLEVGQSGALPEKPAMYYICKERAAASGTIVLYPYLDICPGGEEYVDFNCGGPISNPTTTTPSTITTLTTPPPS